MYDDLILFVKVVENGNYYKVAKSLGQAQSTITRRIQELESRLNLQLINRDCRTFQLTTNGELFFSKVSDIVRQLEVAYDEVLAEYHGLSGTLKIGLPAIINQGMLPQIISEFLNKYPHVKAIIKNSNGPIDLKTENVDIAFSTTLPTTDNTAVELIEKYSLNLYATPEYLKNFGTPKTLEEFYSQHNYVIGTNEDGSLITQYIALNRQSQQETIFPASSSIYSYSAKNSIYFALTHKYCIFSFDLAVQDLLEKGELKQILPEYSFGELSMYLITHHEPLLKTQAEFIKFFKSNLEPVQDKFK